MKQRFSIPFFALLLATGAWAQVQPAAVNDMVPIDEDSRMPIPPLATGFPYPEVAGADARANFVSASVTTGGGYISNLIPGTSAAPVGSAMYTINPSLSLNRTTPRQQESLSYAPGFTYYSKASGLNAFDQGARASYQGRLSPHMALRASDGFVRTSNVFSSGFPFTNGLSGTPTTPVTAVIVPFATQVRNTLDADLTYQFSSKGMIGGGGQYDILRYPKSYQVPGVFESDEKGGSAFYSRRVTGRQFVGLFYKFDEATVHPVNKDTVTYLHSFLPFYFLQLGHQLTLSASAGPQRMTFSETGSQTQTSWKPEAAVSLNWQRQRTNLVFTYLHTIEAGNGLLGAFKANSANAMGNWRISRTSSLNGSYSAEYISALTSPVGLAYTGGHTITLATSFVHQIRETFSISVGYDHLREQFVGLAVVDANPTSDREYVGLSYTFSKPLGR